MYYAFIQDDKINGCGQCEQLTEGVLNIEISEEVYNDIEHYMWNGEAVVFNPNPILPTHEEIKAMRAGAYAVEVDCITAHIQRLRDQNPLPQGEIDELIAERDAKVAEIQERYPYNEDIVA